MTSVEEENGKRNAVERYKPGTQCGPKNLDHRTNPEVDQGVAASYPSRDKTQYPYNFETSTHKILVMAADGKHGPDRWDTISNDPGTSDRPEHAHDDWKRNPPSILQDADPKDSRVGYLAQYRLPDSRDVPSVPGDRLGPTEEQRAKKPKS